MIKLKHRANFGVMVRKKILEFRNRKFINYPNTSNSKDTGYEQVELGVLKIMKMQLDYIGNSVLKNGERFAGLLN